jgi:hypothetical protein
MKRKPPWEEKSGVRVLRFYKSKKHPEWSQRVKKSDLCPDWPRVVLLDLSAKQFSEFHENPLAFAKKYKLYPEQPILWASHVAMPPQGQGIPRAKKGSRWTVVLNHCKTSVGTSAACPQTVD